MKVFLIIVLFCFYKNICIAQIYSGQITDAKGFHPISYANIGIIGKNIGTTSDEDGHFKIELSSEFDNDTICISCIGYKSKKYLIKNFKQGTNNVNEIRIELLPRTFLLPEIVIESIKTTMHLLGNLCDSSSTYGNAFYSKQLGTEIGVLIKLPKKTTKAYLKNFRFYVGEFTLGSFPVRLNIYNLKNGLPYENILKEPILLEIKSTGENIIDLNEKNIIVENDFFISLEYYRIADKADGKLIFCAVHPKSIKQGNGFYRLTSHGYWIPEYNDNIGFSVQIECEY